MRGTSSQEPLGQSRACPEYHNARNALVATVAPRSAQEVLLLHLLAGATAAATHCPRHSTAAATMRGWAGAGMKRAQLPLP